MKTMEKFLHHNGKQPHSRSKANVVGRTLDLSDSLDQSLSTFFPMPVTTSSSQSYSTLHVSQTQTCIGDLTSRPTPRTVAEEPPPLAVGNVVSRPKPGMVKVLWRKVYSGTDITTGVSGSRDITKSQPQTFTTMAKNYHLTPTLDVVSSGQGELAASFSPALISSDGCASSPVSHTTLPHVTVQRAGVVPATSAMQDNVASVLTILRDLGEIAERMPCIKAVAGTTLVLLKIRDEMEDVDEMTAELIDDVWSRSVGLVESLKEVAPRDSSGGGLGGRLEFQLRQYQVLLESIASDLRAMEAQGSIRKALQRLSTRRKIESYRRRLHNFDSTFSAGAFVTLLKQVEKVVQGTNIERHTHNDRISVPSEQPSPNSRGIPSESQNVMSSVHSGRIGTTLPQHCKQSTVVPLSPPPTAATVTALSPRKDSEHDCDPAMPYADGPIEIIPGIWLGSEENARDWNGLMERGIKSILNVAKEVVSPFDQTITSDVHLRTSMSTRNLHDACNSTTTYYTSHPATGRPGMHYLKLHWSHGQSDLVENGFPAGLAFVDAAVQRGQGVLIHGQSGISRSATMVIALLMRAAAEHSPSVTTESWALKCMQGAYSFVKEKSNCVGPNMSLIYQLLDYESQLKKRMNGPSQTFDD